LFRVFLLLFVKLIYLLSECSAYVLTYQSCLSECSSKFLNWFFKLLIITLQTRDLLALNVHFLNQGIYIQSWLIVLFPELIKSAHFRLKLSYFCLITRVLCFDLILVDFKRFEMLGMLVWNKVKLSLKIFILFLKLVCSLNFSTLLDLRVDLLKRRYFRFSSFSEFLWRPQTLRRPFVVLIVIIGSMLVELICKILGLFCYCL